MSRVVYLHIGAPKTGTTYLQSRLDRNAADLRRHGVTFPAGATGPAPSTTHFRAALDLQGMDWGGPPGHAQGAWDALVRRVRRLDGTVLISHELLATATADQVERAMTDLGDGDLHIVFSARDLARQIPAMWQETVKQGRLWPFKKFVRKLQNDPQATFWRQQSIPGVLGRWSRGLTPDRVHLVTVPQPGAPMELLWQRFSGLVGIDPAWAPKDSERANPSMSAAATTVVRRLNRRLRESGIDQEVRRTLVKDVLVQRNLARRPDAAKATLSPKLFPWVSEVTDAWVEWVQGAGIDVVGDVAELYPAPPASSTWVNPDRPDADELVEVAVEALAAMTEEAARRSPDDALAAKVGRAVRRVTGQ